MAQIRIQKMATRPHCKNTWSFPKQGYSVNQNSPNRQAGAFPTRAIVQWNMPETNIIAANFRSKHHILRKKCNKGTLIIMFYQDRT